MAILPTPLPPAAGGLNYSDYQKKIQEQAASTRDIGDTSIPSALKDWKAPWKMQNVGEAAIENYERQEVDLQKKAERAASALEVQGSNVLGGIQRLESIQSRARTSIQSAEDSWGEAAEKADEYVQAARGRVGVVLNKLDTLNKEIKEGRDFAKAHAMQASVQAVLGSMKAEERNIVQNYGADSKEFQQFRMSKMNTLATVQSNIHASYQATEEQRNTAFMNATAEAMNKGNMYVGFQEQQHVEMLKFRDASRNAYALQGAELDLNVEQMKMAGMENLANWMIETPTFSMDATPLISLLSDIAQMDEANRQTELTRQSNERMAKQGGGGGSGGRSGGGSKIRPRTWGL